MDIDVVDVDHVAIRVTDLDRALEFYHDLLGMPIRDRERYEAGEVPYVAVAAGGRHVHLVPTDGGEGTDEPTADASHGFDPGGEHLCFLLRSDRTDSRSELGDLLEELRERGIEVESGEPRKRYGAYGRAWAAYVRDPDGRRVELKIH
ncbi:MAG: VOC family protein [Haloferacaceae archaeon]